MSSAVLARTISICRLIAPAVSCNSRSWRLAAGFIWVDQHTNLRGSRNKLVQKPQTLALQFQPQQAHARDIAPGSIKTRDKADYDRIAGANKYNRNLRSCRLGYRCCWCVRCDDSHVTTYKISGHCLEAIILTSSPLVIYRDVLALDVTAFTESMEESGHINFVSAE